LYLKKRRLTTYLQTANRGICRKPSAGVSIAKFYGKLPSRNPVGMLDYLVKYGPLAVTVSATGNFPNYRYYRNYNLIISWVTDLFNF